MGSFPETYNDPKHHPDPVVLFQSFSPHLILLASHHICLFSDCSWSRNETYSLYFLTKEKDG